MAESQEKEDKIRARVEEVLTQAPLTEEWRDLWRKELAKASLGHATFFLALFGRAESFGDLKDASEMMEKRLRVGEGADSKEEIAKIHREYLQAALDKDTAPPVR